MSTTTLALPERRSALVARAFDYVELTKPRIAVLLLVVVAAATVVATWGQPNPLLMLHAMFGTVLIAGSASAANQWIERERDIFMPRTARRPLPAGRLSAWEVAIFAGVLLVAGLAYMAFVLGLQTAAWGTLTWAIYVLLYTPLKPVTSANTAIGAVAGAMPVLIGWSATGVALDMRALALFLIVFLWQFPHFMAIAWLYRSQYAAAGHQMLTVVDPTGRRAGRQAIVSALALVPVSLVPALQASGWVGLAYFAVATVLGLAQFAIAVWFCATRSEHSARWLMRASLIYLPAVLAMLMLIPWI